MKRIAAFALRHLGRSRGPIVCVLVAAPWAACAGAPWFVGEPLDGKMKIPSTTRTTTVAERRRAADGARAAGHQRIEIASLLALEARAALTGREVRRLAELLEARAADWELLGRPIPLAFDLAHVVRLDPAKADALAARRAAAETAAGDLWRAIGDAAQAEAAAERAIAAGRTVSATDVQERVKRLRAASNAAGHACSASCASSASFAPVVPTASALREPAQDDWLLRGPTLAKTLIPLAALYPQLLAASPRAQSWASALLAEDPTGPDSLEVAARIDARAERIGGAARKLQDLVYYSPDRSHAHARAAAVWAEVKQSRRSCAEWAAAVRDARPESLAPSREPAASTGDEAAQAAPPPPPTPTAEPSHEASAAPPEMTDAVSGNTVAAMATDTVAASVQDDKKAVSPRRLSPPCELVACLEHDRGAGDVEQWRQYLSQRFPKLTCE